MLLLIFVLFLGISACAKNSSNSPVTASGKHSAKWLEKNHTPSNKKASVSLLSCTECHGENFNGGVSKVSCFTCHPKTGV
ncbi:hypothetical protein HY745_10055, partial [Candidatus Desantisbacteria bacterium]|nr:hypothetical protein [Candidatus Desantisbacteria bacterium]